MTTLLLFHYARQFAKLIGRFCLVLTVLVFIVVFFIRSTASDRGVARERHRIAQNTQDALHEKIYDVMEKGSDKEKALAKITAYTTCVTTGDFCYKEKNVRERQGTLVSFISGGLSMPFENPPASGVAWAQTTLANAGLIPNTYAQGMGYVALSSFQEIWKVTRDLTYFVLVIIIVVIGFMIMFNVSAGSKSAVTIEAMLPRLVVTLLLISFSYAIAGLLIDLMYAVMYMVIAVFAPLMNDQGRTTEIIESVTSGQPSDLFWLIWTRPIQTNAIGSASVALHTLIPAPFRYVIDSLVYSFASGAFIGIISSIPSFTIAGATNVPLLNKLKMEVPSLGEKVTNIKGDPNSWKLFKQAFGLSNMPLVTSLMGKIQGMQQGSKDVESKPSTIGGSAEALSFGGGATVTLSIIFMIIRLILIEPIMSVFRSFASWALIFIAISISLIFVFFRVFWMLFGAYVEIIISIMFAPLLIAFNALPGNNAFVEWIQRLALNLLTFPLVVAFLLISSYIMEFSSGEAMWVPPFLTSITSQGAINVLVAGTILFSVPDLISQVKDYLGYKKGFSLSPLSMIGPVLAAISATGGFATQAKSMGQMAQKIGPLAVATNAAGLKDSGGK